MINIIQLILTPTGVGLLLLAIFCLYLRYTIQRKKGEKKKRRTNNHYNEVDTYY